MFRRLFPSSLFNLVIRLESQFRKASISAAYDEELKSQYNAIKTVLPHECHSILDVGCGMAGINVYFSQHYSREDVAFYLLDKSVMDANIIYGFTSQPSFYNSLTVANDLLQLNGISSNNIHLLEATSTKALDIPNSIDLIVSFISWGFHYPVSVYLERIYDILADHGTLILDVRNDTDGLVTLEQKFKTIQTICEYNKYVRVLCSKR